MCLLCSRLAKDTEVFAVGPPDCRGAFFPEASLKRACEETILFVNVSRQNIVLSLKRDRRALVTHLFNIQSWLVVFQILISD